MEDWKQKLGDIAATRAARGSGAVTRCRKLPLITSREYQRPYSPSGQQRKTMLFIWDMAGVPACKRPHNNTAHLLVIAGGWVFSVHKHQHLFPSASLSPPLTQTSKSEETAAFLFHCICVEEFLPVWVSDLIKKKFCRGDCDIPPCDEIIALSPGS